MAERKSYEIGRRHFISKKEAEEYIRSIVAKYRDEEALGHEDYLFVLALIDNHPYAQLKIGAGIEYIIVRRNPVYRGNRGFHLFRIDGTDTDVSWTECLVATPHHKKVIRALRALIEEQTMEFKNRFFDAGGQYCTVTGDLIEFTSSHVDHEPPLTFDRLVADFCKANDVNLQTVEIANEGVDNEYQDRIGDGNLSTAWQEYHRRHARLRVISPRANLSVAKRTQEKR